MRLPLNHVFLFFLITCLTICIPHTYASPGTMPAVPLSALATPEQRSVTQVLNSRTLCNFRHEGERRGRASVGLSGPSFDVNVDKETGLITELYLQNRHLSNFNDLHAITAEEAFANAHIFIKRIGLSLNEFWAIKQNKYLDHGSAGKEYDLQWTKLYHGVELPSLIDVHVDAITGEVFCYLLIDDPVTIPIRVNLTRQEAIQAVINKIKWQHPDVRAADLSIWYIGGYPGPQALLWRLEMANPDATTGRDSYVWADVDAATGEVYSLGEPGGFVKMKPDAKAQGQAIPALKLDLEAIHKDKVPATVFQLAKFKEKKTN